MRGKVKKTHPISLDFQAARNKGGMGVRFHTDGIVRALKGQIGGTKPCVFVESKGCSLRTRSYVNQPQQLEVRQDDVSNSITSIPKDYLVLVSKEKKPKVDTAISSKVSQPMRAGHRLQMKYLSLFSGIGGFEHGIEKAWELVQGAERGSVRSDRRQSGVESGSNEQSEALRDRKLQCSKNPSDEGDEYGLEGTGQETSVEGDEAERDSEHNQGGQCDEEQSGKHLRGGTRTVRSLQSPETEGSEECDESSDEPQQWECVGYSEIDKYAISIYRNHFPTHKNLGDVTKVDTKDIPDFDFLVGGFPCQAFSIAGQRLGFDDTRGTLFFEIIRILRDKKPRFVLLENVKGLLSHDSGFTFQTIIKNIADLGYTVEWQILNSKDFGVPQNRERVFIVGYFGDRSGGKVFPLRQDDEGSLVTQGGTQEEGSRVQGDCASVDTRTGSTARGQHFIEAPKKLTELRYWKNSKEKWVDEQRSTTPVLKTQNDICRQTLIKVGTLRTHNDGKGFRACDSGIAPAIAARAREDGSGQTVIKVKTEKQMIIQKSADFREDGSLREFKDHSPALRANMGDNYPMVIKAPNGKEVDLSNAPAEPCQLFEVRTEKGKKLRKEFREKSGKDMTSRAKDDKKYMAKTDGLANCLTTGKENIEKWVVEPKLTTKYKKLQDTLDKNELVYGEPKSLDLYNKKAQDISPSLQDPCHNSNRLFDGMRIRRLTPVECERLQAFPDGWTQFGTIDIETDGRKCASREVIAIVQNKGKHWVGSNWCQNPQETCPRGKGKDGDYRLCKSVCKQNAHAEVDACKKAGKNARGGTLYLLGHDHCCEECKDIMDVYGIKKVVIGQLPQIEISDSQRYKCLGNGVTTSVVAAVVEKMLRVLPFGSVYIGIDTVRDAVKLYAKKYGVPETVKVLKKFGVSKVTDLNQDQYEAVVNALEIK